MIGGFFMGIGWKKCVLGDIADVQTGPFGSQLHASDYVEYGIPSIMPANIGENLKISTDSIARINEHDAKRLERYLVAETDIVYSRRGDVEKCAFITPKESGWLCGTGCLRVRFTSNEVLPKYCAYYFSTDETKGWISANAVGSTMPNLNSSILENVPLQIPALPTQHTIAEILSSLDDKIDLLTRQNTTLEALAQTYYRQWFVEMASEDWDEVLLSHFISVKYGKDHKHLSDGNIPVYGSGGIMRYADKALYNKESVLIPRKGSLGNVLYINTPFWSVDTMFYTEMKQPNIAKFIYYFICDLDLVSMNVGSAVPSMTTDVLNNLPIVKPPRKLLEKFDIEIATPLFSKVEANTKQIQTLQKLRDTLLPKLISGEIRVKEVS